jgi:hypothetical protein
MIDATRRGFLKIGAAIVGGIAISRYAEPVIKIEQSHDWIEDRGDFVIVRVPDFKSFAKETIDKPAIFILGEKSVIDTVAVAGFANIYAPKGGLVIGSQFDASKMATELERSVLNIKGGCAVQIRDCNIFGGDVAVCFEHPSPGPWPFPRAKVKAIGGAEWLRGVIDRA